MAVIPMDKNNLDDSMVRRLLEQGQLVEARQRSPDAASYPARC